ncbi:unnamed protein product [Allacma fusca]|uniref:BTB domain-containing protein n=1 Tax=Allacma fusca TaxID=39272 RepID=A0A8J2PFY6_9HEXA|nr:unnamed protein product [Allacma fusca]
MFHLKLVRNTQLLSGEKLETLKHCQRRQQFTDLIFICEDKLYFAHKLILASVSTKARYLILDSSSIRVSNIFLPGVKPHDVENMICLLYSGDIWLPRSEIAGLIKTASSLGIDQFEPHREVDIPERLLHTAVSSQTLRNPLKESRSDSSGNRNQGNSRQKLLSGSKLDQENQDAASNSSIYTSFSDSLSTLPSSIGGSSYLGRSRTFGTGKKSKKSTLSNNRSSRPEHLRWEYSDMLNMNLLARDSEDESEFENDNYGDYTFRDDAPYRKSVQRFINPKRADTPIPSLLAHEVDPTACISSDEDTFPGATSIWNSSPVTDSLLESMNDASSDSRRKTRSHTKKLAVTTISNGKLRKKVIRTPKKSTSPNKAGIVVASRGTRAAKVKALNAIQTCAAGTKRKRL